MEFDAFTTGFCSKLSRSLATLSCSQKSNKIKSVSYFKINQKYQLIHFSSLQVHTICVLQLNNYGGAWLRISDTLEQLKNLL